MRPEVAVIIPTYRSERTIGGCLEALGRQSFDAFETVVVDSGPAPLRSPQLGYQSSAVKLVRLPCRLLPHAARNRGVELSQAPLLVFTDPDVYPRPDWLERLVAAHRATGHVVAGALECHGDRWLDLGIHICKFSKWLPGGQPRPVDSAATANMLCSRRLFEALGGFRGDLFLADALFSWQASRVGKLWFEPQAVVAHHHTSGLWGFLRERYQRGILFGLLRSDWHRHGRGRNLLFLGASLLPARLLRISLLMARQCRTAHLGRRFVASLPVALAGQQASLLGESVAYARLLATSAAARRQRVSMPEPAAPRAGSSGPQVSHTPPIGGGGTRSWDRAAGS